MLEAVASSRGPAKLLVLEVGYLRLFVNLCATVWLTYCVPQGEHMTSYCFRRGTATMMTRVLGPELTKAMLHHKQYTTTLFEHYSNNAAEVNTTATVLYGEHDTIVRQTMHDNLALLR